MKVLSLFSGIGATEKALERENIPFDLVNYCEIDKYASKAYSLIHNIDESKNLGDITKIKVEDIPYCDMISHTSPCQSFSAAGKGGGGKRDSGTESSLMWYSVDIILKMKPKIVLWENVANVLSKKHFPVFQEYLSTLEDAGYINSYSILDAKDFGIPQSRKRIFCISRLNNRFSFDSIKTSPSPKLCDIMEKEVDSKYYMTDEQLKRIYNWKAFERPLRKVLGVNSISSTLTARGAGEWRSGIKLYSEKFDNTTDVDLFIGNGALRTRVISDNEQGAKLELRKGDISNCLTTIPTDNVVYNDLGIRRFTPKECFRLVGFDDEDYEKVKDFSDSRLYKMAGNSIVVNVLQAIFKELFRCEGRNKR